MPVEKVYAGKLKTTDLETANSILQRLHRLQEQKELNDRIKKQRLEEVKNHNERVKFLHKLSQAANEIPVYLPDEEKGVNDILNKLQKEELSDANNNKEMELKALEKTIALLHSDSGRFSFVQGNGKIKSVPLRNNLEKSVKNQILPKVRNPLYPLPMLLEEYNVKPLIISDEQNDNIIIPESVWDEAVKDVQEPAPSWKAKYDNKISGKQIMELSGENTENVLEKIFNILQQQKHGYKKETPVLSWKSKNRDPNGFLNDANLNNLLSQLQTGQVDETKNVERNNYFIGSSYEESSEEIDNDVSYDKLDGYSKVFVLLDPSAIKSENDNYQANKMLSKLSSWASKLNKYWQPKTKVLPSLTMNRRRRQHQYADDLDRDRGRERGMRNDHRPMGYRGNNRHRALRGGGGGGGGGGGMQGRMSRTAAPFVHPRGDIYEKNTDD